MTARARAATPRPSRAPAPPAVGTGGFEPREGEAGAVRQGGPRAARGQTEAPPPGPVRIARDDRELERLQRGAGARLARPCRQVPRHALAQADGAHLGPAEPIGDRTGSAPLRADGQGRRSLKDDRAYPSRTAPRCASPAAPPPHTARPAHAVSRAPGRAARPPGSRSCHWRRPGQPHPLRSPAPSRARSRSCRGPQAAPAARDSPSRPRAWRRMARISSRSRAASSNSRLRACAYMRSSSSRMRRSAASGLSAA